MIFMIKILIITNTVVIRMMMIIFIKIMTK